MKRGSTDFLIVYFTLLFIQTVLIGILTPTVTPIGGASFNSNSYYLVRAEDGFHYYSTEGYNEEFELWFDDPTLIEMGPVYLSPQITRGPLLGILDFYEQSSVLTSAAECSRGNNIQLSEAELSVVYQGFLNLAKTDPWLQKYHPGGPPGFQFLPYMTFLSLAKVGTFLAFPAILTWLNLKIDSKRYRAKSNLCPHCDYDCTDLPTNICPECGEPHMVPNS